MIHLDSSVEHYVGPMFSTPLLPLSSATHDAVVLVALQAAVSSGKRVVYVSFHVELIQPSFKALQYHATLYYKSIHSATCHGLFHSHGQQLSSRIACVWCPHDCIPPTMEFASHGPPSLCHYSSSTSSNDYRTTFVGFLPCPVLFLKAVCIMLL